MRNHLFSSFQAASAYEGEGGLYSAQGNRSPVMEGSMQEFERKSDALWDEVFSIHALTRSPSLRFLVVRIFPSRSLICLVRVPIQGADRQVGSPSRRCRPVPSYRRHDRWCRRVRAVHVLVCICELICATELTTTSIVSRVEEAATFARRSSQRPPTRRSFLALAQRSAHTALASSWLRTTARTPTCSART